MSEPLIPKHGGYRKLKSFQIAQLVYDVTVRFCERFIDRHSRTNDQMVQAARSGVQNIAEGSKASATSKKSELKLTNVARASLEELKLDYEDFLRQHNLPLWEMKDPRRAELIKLRPESADSVALWVKQTYEKNKNGSKSIGSIRSIGSIQSTPAAISELAANSALTLIYVAISLLSRQLDSQAAAFENEGGFTERLYRKRQDKRNGQ